VLGTLGEESEQNLAGVLRGSVLRPFIAIQEGLTQQQTRSVSVDELMVRLDSLAAIVTSQAVLVEENETLRGLLTLSERLGPRFKSATVLRPGRPAPKASSCWMWARTMVSARVHPSSAPTGSWGRFGMPDPPAPSGSTGRIRISERARWRWEQMFTAWSRTEGERSGRKTGSSSPERPTTRRSWTERRWSRAVSGAYTPRGADRRHRRGRRSPGHVAEELLASSQGDSRVGHARAGARRGLGEPAHPDGQVGRMPLLPGAVGDDASSRDLRGGGTRGPALSPARGFRHGSGRARPAHGGAPDRGA
jgi:hypothetical protein